MSDNTAAEQRGARPTTIALIIEGIEPMGDLRQFVIDDLTPEDEDEFFRVIGEA
jgi:hypothetical protein